MFPVVWQKLWKLISCLKSIYFLTRFANDSDGTITGFSRTDATDSSKKTGKNIMKFDSLDLLST